MTDPEGQGTKPDPNAETLPHWCDVYLDGLANGLPIVEACKRAGISRVSAWQLRQRNETFARLHENAIAARVDALEHGVLDVCMAAADAALEGPRENLKLEPALVRMILTARQRDRYGPDPKGRELDLDLPEKAAGGEYLMRVTERLVSAVEKGDITVETAERLAKMFELSRRAFEAHEVEAMLASAEEARKARGK